MTTIRFDRAARRDLARLDPSDQKLIIDAIEAFAASGGRAGHVKKLHGYTVPTWRLRVRGPLRVLYRREGATLVILRVGLRRDIYRR